VDIEPGVEARVGLGLSSPDVQLHLEVERMALERCEAPPGGLLGALGDILERLLGPRPAHAHVPGAAAPGETVRIAGPAALVLSPEPTWLGPTSVGRGPFCGIELVLAPLGATGAALEVRSAGSEARLLAPMVVRAAIPELRPAEPGLASVRAEVDAAALAEALRREGSPRALRAALRDGLATGVTWTAR
jgi:hypothetical protein